MVAVRVPASLEAIARELVDLGGSCAGFDFLVNNALQRNLPACGDTVPGRRSDERISSPTQRSVRCLTPRPPTPPRSSLTRPCSRGYSEDERLPFEHKKAQTMKRKPQHVAVLKTAAVEKPRTLDAALALQSARDEAAALRRSLSVAKAEAASAVARARAAEAQGAVAAAASSLNAAAASDLSLHYRRSAQEAGKRSAAAGMALCRRLARATECAAASEKEAACQRQRAAAAELHAELLASTKAKSEATAIRKDMTRRQRVRAALDALGRA